jgi:hypothetical protein
MGQHVNVNLARFLTENNLPQFRRISGGLKLANLAGSEPPGKWLDGAGAVNSACTDFTALECGGKRSFFVA